MLRRLSCAVVLVAGIVSPAVAAQRTYEGQEAAALRCANTLALTAMALSRAELIDPSEKEVMLGISVIILDRHVGGTWAQKKAALEQVRDRRSVEETLEDYQRTAAQCLRQFPIN